MCFWWLVGTCKNLRKMLTFLFCSEENVYLLCKTLCENGVADETGSDLFVVFISNERKQASMFGLCLHYTLFHV